MVNRCLGVQPGWQVSVRASPLARPLVAGGRARDRPPRRLLPPADQLGPRPVPRRPRLGARGAARAARRAAADRALPGRARGRPADDPRTRGRARGRRARPRAAEAAPAGRRSPRAGGRAALDVRWAVVEYPTEAAAAEAGHVAREYTEFIFDACLLDWDAEEQRMPRIKERFDRAASVRIVGEGHRPHDRDRGPPGRRLGRLPQHARRRGLLQPGRGHAPRA